MNRRNIFIIGSVTLVLICVILVYASSEWLYKDDKEINYQDDVVITSQETIEQEELFRDYSTT